MRPGMAQGYLDFVKSNQQEEQNALAMRLKALQAQQMQAQMHAQGLERQQQQEALAGVGGLYAQLARAQQIPPMPGTPRGGPIPPGMGVSSASPGAGGNPASPQPNVPAQAPGAQPVPGPIPPYRALPPGDGLPSQAATPAAGPSEIPPAPGMGNAAAPARQGGLTFDFAIKHLSEAGLQGPVLARALEMLAPRLDKAEQQQFALDQRRWEIQQRAQDKLEQIRIQEQERRITREEADRRALETRREMAMLMAALRPPRAERVEPPAQLYTDQKTGILYERTRDGQWKPAVGPDGPIGGIVRGPGKPAPVPGAGEAAPAGATAVAPGTDVSSATGGTGLFQGLANTAMDALGQKMPFPNTDAAAQALKNLHVQTVTLLQDAVPGRPSAQLMRRLDALAVEPGSLLMGDQRSRTRLQQTRDMLGQEVQRMEREVLAHPEMYTGQQMGKIRQSFSQLRQLQGEYDTVLQGFGRGGRTGGTVSGPIAPRPGAAPRGTTPAAAGTPPPPPGFQVIQPTAPTLH